jgi:hypothetical protein
MAWEFKSPLSHQNIGQGLCSLGSIFLLYIKPKPAEMCAFGGFLPSEDIKLKCPIREKLK